MSGCAVIEGATPKPVTGIMMTAWLLVVDELGKVIPMDTLRGVLGGVGTLALGESTRKAEIGSIVIELS